MMTKERDAKVEDGSRWCAVGEEDERDVSGREKGGRFPVLFGLFIKLF